MEYDGIEALRQRATAFVNIALLLCCLRPYFPYQMTLSGVDPSRVVVGNVVCKAGGVLPAVRRFNAQIVALPALEVGRDRLERGRAMQ